MSTAAVSPRAPAWPVGRQPIWTASGDLHGHEYLYRSRTGRPAQVDRWSAPQQDTATAAVLEIVLTDGVPPGRVRAFVNVTRSYLVRGLPLPVAHDRLVLEVVESVAVDDDVMGGLAALRDLGYHLAIDDFVGTDDQRRMLPFVDYVKLDCRDVERHGAALVDAARVAGARLVAERVSSERRLELASRFEFDLLQGDVLGPAVTVGG